MKKTAILIYNQFCNFEISVVLEILAMAEKPFTIFAKDMSPVISEEGLKVIPDKIMKELIIEEYDSLLLPGAMDIRHTIEDESIINFIKRFDTKDITIGAISIAPILLLKAGMLGEKAFMAGINKEELYEEGFTEKDLVHMTGWDDNLENPVQEGYIITDNIITSVSYNFIKWGLSFCNMLGINIPPETFGLKE